MKMKTWTRETWTFFSLSPQLTFFYYFFVYKFTSSVVGPNVTRKRARDSILVFLVFFSSFCNTACFHHMCFSLRLFRYCLCMWCGLDVVTFSFLCGVASWSSSWRVRKIKRANREMRGEMRFSSVKALKWNKPHYDCMRAYYCIIVSTFLHKIGFRQAYERIAGRPAKKMVERYVKSKLLYHTESSLFTVSPLLPHVVWRFGEVDFFFVFCELCWLWLDLKQCVHFRL